MTPGSSTCLKTIQGHASSTRVYCSGADRSPKRSPQQSCCTRGEFHILHYQHCFPFCHPTSLTTTIIHLSLRGDRAKLLPALSFPPAESHSSAGMWVVRGVSKTPRSVLEWMGCIQIPVGWVCHWMEHIMDQLPLQYLMVILVMSVRVKILLTLYAEQLAPSFLCVSLCIYAGWHPAIVVRRMSSCSQTESQRRH